MVEPSVVTDLRDDARLTAPSTSALPVDRALDAFVTEHYDRLVKLAFLICRHSPDAADAVQRGLEQAWRRRGTLRDGDRLRPWLDRVVVREAIRIGRRPWLRRVFSLDTQVGWAEPMDPVTSQPSDWADLHAAFGRLPADQRAVVVLHHHAGYSVAETAAIVDAPIETVRTRLRRAKDRLRHDLGAPTR